MMKIRLGLAVALFALVLPLAAHADSATKQAVDVTGWIEGVGPTSAVFGEASLARNDNGISMTWQSTGLPAGEPVTIWWIIIEGGNVVSAQFAAGHVVAGNGVGNFGGHLKEGDTSGCFHPDFPCAGLSDSRDATVILLARVHGPKDPGRIPEQIHSGETNYGNAGFEDDLCNPTFCQVQAAIFGPAS
jgi:hypothetical protein